MDFAFIIPILALITLLVALVFALREKKATEDRRHDPDAPKSSLAADGPSHDAAP